MRDDQPPAGLYIHIPFCLRKCPYCDFYSITDLTLESAYVRALTAEMAATDPGHLLFDSLYLGGGTPTALSAASLVKIISRARDTFCFHDDVEVTLEANPGTVNATDWAACIGAGVNRVNIGVQSFDDNRLEFLGRVHKARDAQKAVHQARAAGFENIGLDLIYALPGQRKSDWLSDLEQALELNPEHLSCYMLTCEPGTPLDRDRKKGRFTPLSDDRSAELFEITAAFLRTNGYDQYEISNFARREPRTGSDFRSRHNRKYWTGAPYLGLGPSAHSYLPPRRYWNHRSLSDYIGAIADEKPPLAGQEILTRQQQMIEIVYLGLRTAEGIPLERFEENFGAGFLDLFADLCASLKAEGLLRLSQNRCALTSKGRLKADAIAALFTDNCPLLS